MTALLIAVILILIYLPFEADARKKRVALMGGNKKGSRQVEIEEYTKWATALYDDYCSLTGIKKEDIPMKFTPQWSRCINGYRSYWSEPDIGIKLFYELRDRPALEKLRIKYKLPSDAELFGVFGDKVTYDHKETNYEKLLDLIFMCLTRGIKARGYQPAAEDTELAKIANYNKLNTHDKYGL